MAWNHFADRLWCPPWSYARVAGADSASMPSCRTATTLPRNIQHTGPDNEANRRWHLRNG